MKTESVIAMIVTCSVLVCRANAEEHSTPDPTNYVAYINEFIDPSFRESNYVADISFGWLINYPSQDPNGFFCHDCGIYMFVATNGLVNGFYARHAGWTKISLPASTREQAMLSAANIAQELDADISDFEKSEPLPSWRITYRPRIRTTDVVRETYTIYVEEGTFAPIWYQREYQSYDGFRREP